MEKQKFNSLKMEVEKHINLNSFHAKWTSGENVKRDKKVQELLKLERLLEKILRDGERSIIWQEVESDDIVDQVWGAPKVI